MVFVVAVLAVVLWPGEREPEYQGRKLSEWLEIYVDGRVDPREAEAAVRHIGTNGIPWFIGWIRREPSKSRIWVNTFVETFVSELRRAGKSEPSSSEKAAILASRALRGFQILGTNASAAVPELTERLVACRASNTSWGLALMLVGKDGFSPLVAALRNPHSAHRPFLARCIGRMAYLGTNVQPVAPLLIACMKESDPDLVSCAAVALGYWRLDAEKSLPALMGGPHRPQPACAWELRLRPGTIRYSRRCRNKVFAWAFERYEF